MWHGEAAQRNAAAEAFRPETVSRYTATIMDFIASLSPAEWATLFSAAILIGLTKAGLDGGSLIAVPLMALVFGARPSSGLLLGILMAGDVIAVASYRAQCDLGHLGRTLPWALAGVAIGAAAGGHISEHTFRVLIATGVLSSAVIMAVKQARKSEWVLPRTWWAAAPLGLLAGFASMVGNAAGPVMGLYLLSSGLAKKNIIGTSVTFFFLINIVKLPFHVFLWKTVSPSTLLADAVAAPFAVGATLLGVRIVRIIPEKAYRYFLIAASGAGGIYLLLR